MPAPPPEPPRRCPVCGRQMQPNVTVCPDDGFDFLATDQTLHTPTKGTPRQPPAPTDALVGKPIGDYVVKRRVGQGTAGVVYEAHHREIGRRVAIKVLRTSGDSVAEQQLLEEARLAASIRHRGVIEIYGFGVLPSGTHYIVMEYLEGQSLDLLLKEKGPLQLFDAVEVMDEVLAALSAAHARRVVHRDLKPSNIFRVQQSQGSFIKVLDFGLAKRLRQGESYYTAPTEPNVLLGTPDYMAPEQSSGADVTAKTDLYAVGCIFFELLTGRPPFTGKGPFDVALKHVTEPPPPLKSVMPSAHPMAEAIIARLLAKDPNQRPAAAEDVRKELTKLREAISSSSTQPVSKSEVAVAIAADERRAQSSVLPKPAARPKPSSRRWLLAAGLLLATALGAGAVALLMSR